MNYLVLSTLPHYLALYPKNNSLYRAVIFTSSTLSVLWHIYNEPINIIFYLDYAAAAIWFFYDIFLGFHTKNIYTIFILNFIVFILNQSIKNEYVFYHSVWHIMSAIKCYYIASIASNIQIS